MYVDVGQANDFFRFVITARLVSEVGGVAAVMSDGRWPAKLLDGLVHQRHVGLRQLHTLWGRSGDILGTHQLDRCHRNGDMSCRMGACL